MNVFAREIKRNYKGTLLWAAALSLMNFVVMYLFPSIAQQSKGWDRLMSFMPKGLLAGFDMDKLKLSDIYGYYGTQVYTLVLLFGAIFAIMLLSGILSKEENERTVEFLLAKPITRNGMVTGKILSGLSLVFLFNLILYVTTYISFAVFHTKPFDAEILLILSLGSLLLDVVFAVAGLFLSVFVVKGKTIISAAVGIVLVEYILGIAAGMSDKFHFLKIFTPFRYVDPANLIINKSMDAGHLLISFVLIAAFVFGTYFFYNKKDIAA